MPETSPTSNFYYPLLFLVPDFESDAIEYTPFRLARRKWQTTIFDLATLATKHDLALPYQVMDVFLSRCNMELCVIGKASLTEANEAFQALKLALYLEGVSPFTSPFITTHSINEYSGINSRDSEMGKLKLHPGLQEGLTSATGRVRAWPAELSFQCTAISERLAVSNEIFREAVVKAAIWQELLTKHPQLNAVMNAALAAPTLGSLSQSLLHIWSALEALFPSVSSEVSFRIALYIAQLTGPEKDRLSRYEAVRTAYGIRSKVAHGAKATVSLEEWNQAWDLLRDCLDALCQRQSLPAEQELLRELLG